VNLEHVRRIATETGLPVQLGGGLRSPAALEEAVAAGASRLVLGTAAFTDLLEHALAAHGERLVVSIDVRSGCVSTAGWTQTTQLRALDAIGALQDRGVRNFVYTDVDRDGMLGGLDNADIVGVADAVGARGGELLYSGGIGELADLEALSRLRHAALVGVIVGKALYESRFTIVEAEAALCS
jgi:phosphoribosylformimino-5-aminoimidazole carboxamide ribotide isomerase